MAIEMILQANLARLVSGFDSQLAFATQAGLSGQYLNQLLMGVGTSARKQRGRSRRR